MSGTYRFLRCYGALVVFIVTLATQLIGGALAGREPVPQVPSPGHVAEEYQVRLEWTDDGLAPPFVVQVADEDGGFETPRVELRAEEGTSVHLPPLEPGRVWRWRVMHEATGTVSRESSFRTAAALINY